MKAMSIVVLMAAILPSLPAQDPAKGEYRALIVPDPLKYTPISLMSVTPTGSILALDSKGNILNGTDRAWQMLAGNLVQLSAGTDTEIWGVNAAHAVFRWTGSTWAAMPGYLQQVAVAKGGGLVMGIEWTYPHRIVRWDSAANTWIPLAAAPPIVQLSIGSPNHVFGIVATGEIYRLKRPEWTEWRLIKGKLKQISVGMDGTVGGIGTDGVAYVRGDQDIAAEIGNPAIVPSWTAINASVVQVEIVKLDSVFTLGNSGFPATAQVLSSGNTLTIQDAVVVVNGTPGPPLSDGTSLYSADQPKAESTGCITVTKDTVIDLSKLPKSGDGSQPLFSFKCPTGTFKKINISRCTPNARMAYGPELMPPQNKGGCMGSNQGVTPTDPVQIDGKGTDCAPRTFSNRSAHSSVSFILPGGRVGEKVTIPAGAHNRYVFPACNRVMWDNLTFSCGASKVWTLTQGKYDADAWCTGTPGRSPYTSISDLGYADK